MKNMLIIGASSGIGKALAHQLAAAGNQVFGTYHSTRSMASENLQFHGLNVLDDELDLSFVPDELHGLVYCPGSINLKPFHRIKPDEFAEDLQLQTIGAIKVIQTVLPKLKAGKGSIVLFSTVAVQQGFNFHAQVAVSKGAIEGLTRSLAAEFAPTVRVNCIAPSLTDTPLAEKLLNSDQKREANAERHPLKRVGTSTDIANAAGFLLSEDSSWMTGQILKIDGGMSSIKT
jgi:NAD(P)-dependent dehydrogenase (short-subunit alcohol dehydrogenase family)